MLPIIFILAAVLAAVFIAEHFQNRKRHDGSGSGETEEPRK